jgi:hypothetical protein
MWGLVISGKRGSELADSDAASGKVHHQSLHRRLAGLAPGLVSASSLQRCCWPRACRRRGDRQVAGWQRSAPEQASVGQACAHNNGIQRSNSHSTLSRDQPLAPRSAHGLITSRAGCPARMGFCTGRHVRQVSTAQHHKCHHHRLPGLRTFWTAVDWSRHAAELRVPAPCVPAFIRVLRGADWPGGMPTVLIGCFARLCSGHDGRRSSPLLWLEKCFLLAGRLPRRGSRGEGGRLWRRYRERRSIWTWRALWRTA